MKLATSLMYIAPAVMADMYLQFPGGSNNRLREDSRNVQNQNRLFDSQNNNRFGYNQATYAFHTDSEINLRWTIQHGCGPDSNVNCEVILQYACGENLRDGTTTQTIPTDQDDCENNDCNTDFKFGMHEDWQSYQHCSIREQNHRLFNADQRLNGENARYTRQDNNGQRFGYQCNEERDYYPYWQPTIWKDIVVMTDDLDRCDYFKSESENVKGRSHCHLPKKLLDHFYEETDRNKAVVPLNQTHCEMLRDEVLADDDLVQELDLQSEDVIKWQTHDPHGIDAPDCVLNQHHRDNHHGNVEDSRYFAGYKWTVPHDLVNEQCTFRIRYNMTSSDYDAFNTDVDNHIRDDTHCMCRNNYGADMWSHLGMTGKEAKERGYRHKNDSPIKIFKDVDMWLDMAYNTDQLGRTFEDRSHIVKFRALPEKVYKDIKSNDRKIYNLNAMGKIGNYVEVYPNFEFDFVPQRLQAEVGDYLHIQWAGSNTNPYHNDGSQVNYKDDTIEIAKRKDRHNIVAINNMTSIFPDLDKIDSIFGFEAGDALKLATDGIHGGDNEYLQASGAAFDMGLMKLEKSGKWMFMSSHNNRFGVRTQKGKVIVTDEVSDNDFSLKG